MDQPLTEQDLAPRNEPTGVVVSNPAWKKYMRLDDVWEDNHDGCTLPADQ
jgi:hypothetical protein